MKVDKIRFNKSAALDPSRAEHNIARVDDISVASESFGRRFSSGVPLFTRIEWSITDLCNRTCVFCPRTDPALYPNNDEEISLELYEKIVRELADLQWAGGMSYSGFGEPLLHTRLDDLIRMTKEHLPEVVLDVVTNGDRITERRARELFDAGLDCLKISLYDGKEQIAPFEEMKRRLGASDKQFILRHRFYGPDQSFGLILSNRAGMVSFPNLPLEPLAEPLQQECFFPFYKLMVDFDGRVLLCSHDWGKKLIAGDLRTETIEAVWTGRTMQGVRRQLANRRRSFMPCKGCNVDGRLNGREAFERWLDAPSAETQP